MPGLRREYLVLGVATLVWGSLHPAGKIALRELDPGHLVLLRPVLACLVLTLLVVLTGKAQKVPGIVRGHPGTLLALGLFGYAGAGGLAMISLHFLPAGITSLLGNTSSLMLVAAAPFLRLPVHRWQVIGAAVGFSGVAILTAGGAAPVGGLGPTLVGVTLALTGSALWTAYTVLAQRLAGSDPVVTTCITAAIGAALVAVVAIPTQDWSKLTTASPGALAAAVWVGAIATGGTYAAWGYALRHLPAASVTPFGYLIPTSALLIANRLLDEPLTPAVVGGAALVLGGVAVSQVRVIPPPERKVA